mmetsp:Transcript_37982/g.119179  ORF Transcript_37982/g.119179 Transcript_37982/m.119179 type:complete len:336 (-) Transcript_37982:20-1027(-)
MGRQKRARAGMLLRRKVPLRHDVLSHHVEVEASHRVVGASDTQGAQQQPPRSGAAALQDAEDGAVGLAPELRQRRLQHGRRQQLAELFQVRRCVRTAEGPRRRPPPPLYRRRLLPFLHAHVFPKVRLLLLLHEALRQGLPARVLAGQLVLGGRPDPKGCGRFAEAVGAVAPGHEAFELPADVELRGVVAGPRLEHLPRVSVLRPGPAAQARLLGVSQARAGDPEHQREPPEESAHEPDALGGAGQVSRLEEGQRRPGEPRPEVLAGVGRERQPRPRPRACFFARQRCRHRPRREHGGRVLADVPQLQHVRALLSGLGLGFTLGGGVGWIRFRLSS